MFESYQPYITVVINAIFTGAGVAIGTWFSNTAIIRHLELIENKLNKRGVKNGFIHKKKAARSSKDLRRG